MNKNNTKVKKWKRGCLYLGESDIIIIYKIILNSENKIMLF